MLTADSVFVLPLLSHRADAAMIPVREYIRENKLAANDHALEKVKANVSCLC